MTCGADRTTGGTGRTVGRAADATGGLCLCPETATLTTAITAITMAPAAISSQPGRPRPGGRDEPKATSSNPSASAGRAPENEPTLHHLPPRVPRGRVNGTLLWIEAQQRYIDLG